MFEIYTKENCIYCDKIKSLLNHHNLDFKQYIVGQDCTKEDIQERVGPDKKINVVPQIFHDGNYVGGYLETVEHIAYDKHLTKV